MKRNTPKYKALLISLILSGLMLIIGMHYMEGLTCHRLIKRLVIPLSRLMGYIIIGLAAGQILEASGWTRHLSVMARPMFRFGNLGDRCGAAFTSAFVSGVTANAMLLEFYQEKKITRQQLFVTNFVNQFPAYFLHLPTTLFIVLPLTGKAGGIYYLLTFIATLLRTFLFLLYGRFFITPEKIDDRIEAPEQKNRKKTGILRGLKEKLPARTINIFVYVLPVYIGVFVVQGLGFFDAANDFVARKISLSFIPVESLSVVVLSFAAEFTSGFAAAGAFLEAGLMDVKQTAMALLLGNIIAFPIRAIRHQLPRYIGIYSPKMGTQLLLMGQLFRVLSLIFVGVGFYLLF